MPDTSPIQHITNLPKIIAICGNPTAGKTTAGEIIRDHFGYILNDDGRPLREIAVRYLGLTEEHVYTQAGKLMEVEINNRIWTTREVLGEIGNAFEEKFGEDVIPMMSHKLMSPTEGYVTASVRRNQGIYWAKQGALVLEIVNPAAGPSNYEFDSYNKAAVHRSVLNDGLFEGLSVEDAHLRLKTRLLEAILGL